MCNAHHDQEERSIEWRMKNELSVHALFRFSCCQFYLESYHGCRYGGARRFSLCSPCRHSIPPKLFDMLFCIFVKLTSFEFYDLLCFAFLFVYVVYIKFKLLYCLNLLGGEFSFVLWALFLLFVRSHNLSHTHIRAHFTIFKLLKLKFFFNRCLTLWDAKQLGHFNSKISAKCILFKIQKTNLGTT